MTESFKANMRRKIDAYDDRERKIKALLHIGIINENQAGYAQDLIFLNFTLNEARALADIGELIDSANALVQAKKSLDNIARYAVLKNNPRIYGRAKKRYAAVEANIEVLS